MVLEGYNEFIKFSIKYFFSKCGQIRKKLRIWSNLLKKSLMENFIFCAVFYFVGDFPYYWKQMFFWLVY